MKIQRKWLAVLTIFLLITSIVAAVIVIQLWLSTRVTLIVPHDIRVEPMTWDWGALPMEFGLDTAVSTQEVMVTSYGAKPLTLSAMVEGSSVAPAWLMPHYYSLDWTAEDYEIQPLEILETNFTLTVDVPLVREYMITNQIMEVDITFDIIVSADYVTIYHNLTIETTPNGITDPAPGVHEYREGKIVTVTGIPDIGCRVECWNLDGVNYTTGNSISVTMDTDHYLIAYFEVSPPRLYVDPASVGVGVGETFTIAVRLDDVFELYGLDIQFAWNPTLLTYIDHTVKVPVETYPDGILYDYTMIVVNTVDEIAGTYQLVCSSMAPAPSFNGSGIVFEMTFEVQDVGACTLDIVSSDLVSGPTIVGPIEHTVEDGYFDNT